MVVAAGVGRIAGGQYRAGGGVHAMKEKAIIEVFKNEGDWHPYPWMFAVTHNGVRHVFIGIQNQCATKRAATMRARWRARWLEDGTYARRHV